MKTWLERSHEEQRLLNPSFCAVLLWNSASGYRRQSHDSGSLPFPEAFLVLPAVLHAETRNSLPRSITTSLAVWVEENPLSRAVIRDRARLLVPFTKEAILFGLTHKIFRLYRGGISAEPQWKQKIEATVEASDEVEFCAKRATFLGRWFAKTGDVETVMALLGVRP